MDIAIFFPFLLIIGVMFLMSRSAKNRQRQVEQMRESMQPGTGVRTIGGMYAVVKDVREDTVVLEIESGVHAVFAKNAVGAVLEDEEYRRIVSGEPDPEEGLSTVPDDASSLSDGERDDRVDLDKNADADDETDRPGRRGGDSGSGPAS